MCSTRPFDEIVESAVCQKKTYQRRREASECEIKQIT